MLKRTHQFVVTVTFDKPTTKAHALAEVKDNIHSEFFCGQRYEPRTGDFIGPATFRIRSFKNLPTTKA